MAGFNFYQRRGEVFHDNLFFKGAAVTNNEITVANLPSKFTSGTLLQNLEKEGDIIKGYIYRSSGGVMIVSSAFRDMSDLECVIIENRGVFSINDDNSFEFFNTKIDYIWIPYIQNGGKQAFQHAKWKKRAYLPFLTDFGARTIYANSIDSTSTLRIYAPLCNRILLESFCFQGQTITGKFNNATLYLNTTWTGSTNAGLAAFVNSGGTVVIIQDYTQPTTPTNLVISNITSTSIKVDFNPSTFTNTFGWYEVFCKEEGNPVSKYFHHKEITSNSATITGLKPNTNYFVSVRGADEYMNLSNFSNEVAIKTLTI